MKNKRSVKVDCVTGTHILSWWPNVHSVSYVCTPRICKTERRSSGCMAALSFTRYFWNTKLRKQLLRPVVSPNPDTTPFKCVWTYIFFLNKTCTLNCSTELLSTPVYLWVPVLSQQLALEAVHFCGKFWTIQLKEEVLKGFKSVPELLGRGKMSMAQALGQVPRAVRTLVPSITILMSSCDRLVWML